jgi:hypothetical protein
MKERDREGKEQVDVKKEYEGKRKDAGYVTK